MELSANITLRITLALALMLPAALYPQNQAGLPDAPSPLDSPSKFILPDAVRTLEEELDSLGPNPPDNGITFERAAGIESRANEILRPYLEQFTKDKRTLNERQFERRLDVPTDLNEIRLFAKRVKSGALLPHPREPMPLLVRLYSVLGRTHEIRNDAAGAYRNYRTALDYSGDRADISLTFNDIKLEEREKAYLTLLKSYASSERILEAADERDRDNALMFRRLIEEYTSKQKEWREADVAVYLSEARRARGMDGESVESARIRKERALADKENLTSQMEAIRTGAAATWIKSEGKRNATLAFRMALLLRPLEEENAVSTHAENRSSFLKGDGDLPATVISVTRTHPGYAALLEVARLYDPFEFNYPALLANEYRNRHENRRAIEMAEEALKLAQGREPPVKDESLSDLYYLAGGLWSDAKNPIRAVDAYEKMLRYEKNGRRRLSVIYNIAELKFKRTGGHPQAIEALYTELLNNTPYPPAPQTQGEDQGRFWPGPAQFGEAPLLTSGQEILIARYKYRERLSTLARRRQLSSLEYDRLLATRGEFQMLIRDRANLDRNIAAIDREIAELKRVLFTKNDEELNQRYETLLHLDRVEAQRKRDYLQTMMDSLRYPLLLERLAVLTWRERRFNESAGYYTELLTEGRGETITRARENLQRLESFKRDGFAQTPMLPPDFER